MPRMMGCRRRPVIACAALALAFATFASVHAPRAAAQAVPKLDIERFSPATGPDSYFGVEATRTVASR